MKKALVLSICFSLIFLGVIAAVADNQKRIQCIALVNAGAVVASGTSTYGDPNGTTTTLINLDDYRPEGYFSLQVTVHGAGAETTWDYNLSNDGTNFINAGTDIATGIGVASGTTIFSFPSNEPMLAKYMQIRCTETAGSGVTSVTAILCIQ